jgi:transcriptional regulator with XRE-family HTH domain
VQLEWLYPSRYNGEVALPELLRKARAGSGLGQIELAKRAGTSQPTLCSYENGHKTPRFDVVERIFEAAGYELSVQPRIQDDGIDRSQIRFMLSMTPADRLRYSIAASQRLLPLLGAARKPS